MDTILRDLRYAARLYGRNPGFTMVAVLTLTLGIGVNTAMFSVVHSTLLQPLPFPDAARLMTIWQGRAAEPDDLGICSLPNFRDWQSRSRSFGSMALFDSSGRGYNLGAATSRGGAPGAQAAQVSGGRVTASFFTVLGVQPMLGRTFDASEEAPGHDIVILSYRLWSRRFAADPAIVGRTIPIDGRPFTVVGVMPESFRFQFWSGERQLWVPAGWTSGDADRGSNSFIAIGRLRPGVTVEQARGEMDVIGRALATTYPDENAGQTLRVVPLQAYGLSGVRPVLYSLLGVVGFVLLIACVNVANLMLARVSTRARELAVRRALGATRGRIVQQLLTESVLLAIAGGTCGLLVALAGTRVLRPILPDDLSGLPMRPLERIEIDGTVLAFTILIALICSVLFGLAPAFLSARDDVNGSLKAQTRGSTSGRNRLRYGLVCAEVALTLVVLAGAGVLMVSLARLLRVDPGLDPTHVLVMGLSLPQENLYYGPPGDTQFCDKLAQQVGTLPGVRSASAIANLPLSGANAGRGIVIEGKPDPGPERRSGANYSVACPAILTTLGIPLRAGREFTARDTVGSTPVALINESFATRYWPGEDPIGKRFTLGQADDEESMLTVVGVYADVRHGGLDDRAWPQFFRPYAQAGWPFMAIVTKTVSAPGAFVTPVTRALAIVAPDQPVSAATTMEAVIGRSVSSRRFPMLLLSGFALLSLVLAAVGIAGVVGYAVVQRTPEIGVRVALGAQPGDVLRLVIGQSLLWMLAGVAIGLAGCLALLRFLQTLLFGVTATDPLVLGTVSALLLGVALTASYLPARRALRVDPATALRRS